MRPETGAMRFEGDWRGVFIRGDNAFGYASYLGIAIQKMEDSVYKAGLEGLLELLLSSDERNADVETQNMNAFEDCVASPRPDDFNSSSNL